MKRRAIVLTLLLVVVAAVASAAGQTPALVPLPADLTGAIDGVPYRIRVPANWNGTLLVYAHGYNETPATPYLVPQPGDETVLLEKGYALAASRFAGSVPMSGMSSEGGTTIKNALQNIVDLTTAFRDSVGPPSRTIMWGKSMGGLIALNVIEKFPGLFDAAVALCPTAAGTPRVFDQKLDITVAYAAAFGWDPAWGTPGNLNPDLMTTFMTTMYPQVMQQVTPTKKGLWEFLRLVNHLPADASFYGPMNFRLTSLYMSIMPRIDLDRRAGGCVAENVGRVYTLSDVDKAYLRTTFNVDPDPLLAAMNAMTIYLSDRNARNYARHYFEPTGRLTRPVLTLHTTGDALATPHNESAYFEVVKDAGSLDLLMQQFTSGNGTANTHCTFTSAQEIAAIEAMMSWLDTDSRPDASFFPVEKLFVPGYVPPSWPW